MHTSTQAAGVASAQPSRFWPHGLMFVAVPFLVSKVPGSLVFALNPDAADDIGLTAVPVPAWVFIAVWSVIHPSMGMAAWLVWRGREAPGRDVFAPLALLLVGFLQTFTFWFTDSLRSTAVIDATGVLLAVAAWSAVRRHSRAGARWLLPWVVWMPVTFAVKIAVITGVLSA